jgi:hypothetical protein
MQILTAVPGACLKHQITYYICIIRIILPYLVFIIDERLSVETGFIDWPVTQHTALFVPGADTQQFDPSVQHPLQHHQTVCCAHTV